MSTNHGSADGADRPAEYFSFYKFLIIKRYKFKDIFFSLKSVGNVQSKIMDFETSQLLQFSATDKKHNK